MNQTIISNAQRVFCIKGLRKLIFDFLKTPHQLREIYIQCHPIFPMITLYYDSKTRMLFKKRTITRLKKNKIYRKYYGLYDKYDAIKQRSKRLRIKDDTDLSHILLGTIRWVIIYNKIKYDVFESDIIDNLHDSKEIIKFNF